MMIATEPFHKHPKSISSELSSMAVKARDLLALGGNTVVGCQLHSDEVTGKDSYVTSRTPTEEYKKRKRSAGVSQTEVGR